MRLQTFLSRAGVVSRRAAVKVVRSGKICVNGRKVFEPSFRVDPKKDRIFFNNKRIFPRKYIYIMLHKPKGVITTKKDPYATRTVMDLLPRKYSHLNPIGRLDKDTTGLLVLANDGELANKLTHPKFNVKKVYEAALDKRLSDIDKARIERGISLDGRHTAPCRISLRKGNGLEVTLHEGKKRQIKRMFAVLGYRVINLKRIGEGFLSLARLGIGKWRFLTDKEVFELTR